MMLMIISDKRCNRSQFDQCSPKQPANRIHNKHKNTLEGYIHKSCNSMNSLSTFKLKKQVNFIDMLNITKHRILCQSKSAGHSTRGDARGTADGMQDETCMILYIISGAFDMELSRTRRRQTQSSFNFHLLNIL